MHLISKWKGIFILNRVYFVPIKDMVFVSEQCLRFENSWRSENPSRRSSWASDSSDEHVTNNRDVITTSAARGPIVSTETN